MMISIPITEAVEAASSGSGSSGPVVMLQSPPPKRKKKTPGQVSVTIMERVGAMMVSIPMKEAADALGKP